MTDCELNKAIAEALGHEVEMTYHKNMYLNGNRSVPVDYCKDWSQLMPLVVEHKISLDWDSFNWTAFQSKFHEDGEHLGCGYETTLISPQRALAECLLKVSTN